VCAPELLLEVESIDVLASLPRVSARVRTPNLRVRAGSVRLMRVELLNESQARPLDSGQNAELIVAVDADASPQAGAITAPDLPTGAYLLSWSPLAPDGQSLGFCQQVILVNGQ
jgi:hypothetical protein